MRLTVLRIIATHPSSHHLRRTRFYFIRPVALVADVQTKRARGARFAMY